MQSQHLMEREPYFKPLNDSRVLTSTSEDSYFAPLRTPPAMVQQQGDGTWVASETNTQSSSERLSTLHSKLHQEADKIRKWKLHTELELKRKNEQLRDTSTAVEQLRKSLLDLQIQNQSLSTNLQAEVENREEILQRISSTRSMCSYLKEFASKIDENLMECDCERIELKGQVSEYAKEFEELTSKFKELKVVAQEEVQYLQDIIDKLKNENQEVTDEWTTKLSNMEIKLSETVSQLDEKGASLVNTTAALDEKVKTITNLNAEIECLNLKVKNCEEAEEKQLEEFNHLKSEMDQLEKFKNDMEKTLDQTSNKLQDALFSKEKLARNFDETEKLYVEKIQTLQEEVHDIKLQLEDTQDKLNETKSDLSSTENVVEDLKSVKDMLILERTELQKKFSDLEKVKNNLEETKTGLEENLKMEENEVESLLNKMDEQKEKYQALQEKFEDGLKDMAKKVEECEIMNANIEWLKLSLKEREDELSVTTQKLKESVEREFKQEKDVERMTDKLIHEVDEREKCCAEMETLKGEKVQFQEELKQKQKEINKITKELEASKATHGRLQGKLDEAYKITGALKENIQEMEAEVRQQAEDAEKRIRDEIEATKGLQSELNTKAKATTNLETKTKDLKSDITAKKKEIKELEKEIKSLKCQLTQQGKQMNSLEEAHTLLEEEKADLTEWKANLESQMAELEETLSAKTAEIESIVKEKEGLKKIADKAVQEKEAETKKFDKQMNEMVATLEKYKQENNKIVQQKQKEIEQLRKSVDSDVKKKNAEQRVISVMEQEILVLKNDMTDYKNNLEQCKEDISQKESHVSDLESQISDRDERIKFLESEIANLTTSLEDSRKATEAAQKISENLQKAVPQTPRMRNVIPRTPKQLAQVSPMREPTMTSTPMQMLRTPAVSGLLKPAGSASLKKKRRVNFGADTKGDSGSNSSSPGLMEIEFDETKKTSIKAKTPILIAPSPRMKVGTSPHSKATFAQPKPVARGPPVKQRKIKGNLESSIKADIEKFKHTYPVPISPQKNAMQVKQTPSRSGGRFFKSYSVERKTKQFRLPKAAEGTNWLDSDDVFGFDDTL